MKFDVLVQILLVWPTAIIDIQRATLDGYSKMLDAYVKQQEKK